MTTHATAPSPTVRPSIPATLRAPAPTPSAAGRYFYSAAALLMLVIAVVGFGRFYFQGMAYPGRPLTPPIRGLVIAHGITMSLWMVMLVVQPLLVATGKRRVHMTMGWVGTALAAVVVVTGVMIGCGFARHMPPEAKMWGIAPLDFTIVPLGAIAIFAACVALGVAWRRKPALHRPMMLLGTLAAITAALNRIDTLNNLYLGTVLDTVFGPFLFAVVLGALLVGVRSVLQKRLDRPLAIGTATVLLLLVGMWHAATTPAWRTVAATIAG